MASPHPTSPSDKDGGGFPVLPVNATGPPSVMSSQLSDGGSEFDPQGRKSAMSKAPSRPGTGMTGDSYVTTSVAASPNVRNSVTSWKRESVSSMRDGRTKSIASKSHVPSLTSNAFFRPMSSQKLQAHRGGTTSRPTTMSSPVQIPNLNLDDGATDIGGSVMRRSTSTTRPPAETGIHRQLSDENLQLPPSRGTEVTEHDRITANTSPSGGHYAGGSLSDSVRPLRKTPDSHHPNLDVNTKHYPDGEKNPASPIKSPRSFRSSFLMPGRSNSGHARNRSTEGAEKLSSCASSPKLNPADRRGQPKQTSSSQRPATSLGRVYQYFEGNTNFWFGGRWQNTVGKPINFGTGLLIIIPCVLFFAFEASWLWHNISPAIPIVFAYVAFICFSSFLHASTSDPGILPRNTHRFPAVDENEDPLLLGPRTNDWVLVKSAESKTAAMEVPVKHCRTCNIWRPPRGHHCRLCDNCIEGHDHHCVWLNNCVGKRNYRFFFAFVASGTLLALFIIATSLVQILVHQKREKISFGQSIDHFRGAFALLILAAIEFLYPAALMGYHVFLMARGETTREYMNSHKFAKKERFRAFSQKSIVKNILSVLCRPRPPTYYRFKSGYQKGDQRLGMRRDLRPKEDPLGLEMDNVTSPTATGFQGPVSLRGEQDR